MKLELKHIAPYLPYGLNFHCVDIESGEYEELPFTSISLSDGFEELRIGNQEIEIDDLFANDYKPILRPLTDFTKEIEINGEKFYPCHRIHFNIDGTAFKENIAGQECPTWGWKTSLNFNHSHQNYFDIFRAFNDNWIKLFTMHFDVYGLIDQGLAIDINSINQAH